MSNHNQSFVPDGAPGKRRRASLAAAIRPIVEILESRVHLSFSAAYAGVPGQAITGGNEQFVVTTTGSVVPSAETEYAGDGSSFTPTFGSTSPTISTPLYMHTEGTLTTAPTASVTPTGGTAQTIPLTLDSNYNNVGGAATVGSEVALPTGATSSNDNSGAAILVDPSNGDTYVASNYNKTSTTSQFAVSKYNKTGSLYTGWGANRNGTTTISFDSGVDTPTSLYLDTTNQLLLVAGNSSTQGWSVARLDISVTGNGVLDTSFGSLGTESNFQTTGKCLSVTEQIDPNHNEYVVLVGHQPSGNNTQMLAVRLTSAGALDSQHFGTGGKMAITGFSGSISAQANYVTQAPSTLDSQDLLVGGWSSRNENGHTACDFAVAALSDNDGSLDTTTPFGSGGSPNGTVTANFHDTTNSLPNGINGCCGCGSFSNDSDYSIVPWEDSSNVWHIYAVGGTNFSGSYTFGLVRLTALGKIDTGWKSGGYQAVLSGAAANQAQALAATLQGSGPTDSNAKLIAVGGEPGSSSASAFTVARFNMNGNLDNSFGSSGSIRTDLASNVSGNTYNYGYDKALGVGWDSTDGIIIVGGSSASSYTANGLIGLAAYVDNGQTDTTGAPSGGPPPAALALQPAVASSADPSTDGAGGDLSDLLTPATHRKTAHRQHASVFRTG